MIVWTQFLDAGLSVGDLHVCVDSVSGGGEDLAGIVLWSGRRDSSR